MPIFDDIARRMETARSQGRRPLVVLDVDDTLIDCRYRKHKVFLDFVERPDVRERWPEACRRIQALPWEQVRYRVPDNLSLAGIQDEDFSKAIIDFWLQHYFTYPYLILDRAFPRAQAFVHRCRSLGADIVYLTARDHLGMYKGTIDALKGLDFPLHSPDVHVMLKPDAAMNDHHFKVEALEPIASLGTVVASLENELINLNAMAERFPEAGMYWRNTLYAPNPPSPHPRVEILEHFP